MWPIRHKDKLHHVYVIHDEKNGLFKIGLTHDLDGRLSSLGPRRLRLKIYKSWTDYEVFIAKFIEDAAIALITDWGFKKVRADDWFEIDEPTMKAVIETISDLTKAIRRWEFCNRVEECLVIHTDSPYGQYLKQHKAAGTLPSQLGTEAETYVRLVEREQRERDLRLQKYRAARESKRLSG